MGRSDLLPYSYHQGSKKCLKKKKIGPRTWEAISKNLAFSTWDLKQLPKHTILTEVEGSKKNNEDSFLHREVVVLYKEKNIGVESMQEHLLFPWKQSAQQMAFTLKRLNSLRIGNYHPETERKKSWFSGYVPFKRGWLLKWYLKKKKCDSVIWSSDFTCSSPLLL